MVKITNIIKNVLKKYYIILILLIVLIVIYFIYKSYYETYTSIKANTRNSKTISFKGISNNGLSYPVSIFQVDQNENIKNSNNFVFTNNQTFNVTTSGTNVSGNAGTYGWGVSISTFTSKATSLTLDFSSSKYYVALSDGEDLTVFKPMLMINNKLNKSYVKISNKKVIINVPTGYNKIFVSLKFL